MKLTRSDRGVLELQGFRSSIEMRPEERRLAKLSSMDLTGWF